MNKEEIEELLEKLAALEHEQWIAWSQNLTQNELLSYERLERWKALWIPYEQLTEEQKEQDRTWAAKVMTIFISVLENKE